MKKFGYVLLFVILIALFISLSTLSKIKAPLVEIANLPRCANEVVVSPDLKFAAINYSNQRIIQGTGDSYFSHHFIFKGLDYSLDQCTFIVRYEYTNFPVHSEMSMTLVARPTGQFEVVDTNTFLRPVGILVNDKTAEEIASLRKISYDYYNLEIDISQQTFFYKFYKNTITGGKTLVLTVDAQSKEIVEPEGIKENVPFI